MANTSDLAVLANAAARLARLAIELSEVGIDDRGYGWRDALEALYEAIDACSGDDLGRAEVVLWDCAHAIAQAENIGITAHRVVKECHAKVKEALEPRPDFWMRTLFGQVPQ